MRARFPGVFLAVCLMGLTAPLIAHHGAASFDTTES